MSDIAQMESNIACMTEFKPLTTTEFEVIDQVTEILKGQDMIPCTGCRYCVAGCPKKIQIPDLFACANSMKRFHDWSSAYYYDLHTYKHGRPEDCIRCRKCEKICPQHLHITELLPEVISIFAK